MLSISTLLFQLVRLLLPSVRTDSWTLAMPEHQSIFDFPSDISIGSIHLGLAAQVYPRGATPTPTHDPDAAQMRPRCVPCHPPILPILRRRSQEALLTSVTALVPNVIGKLLQYSALEQKFDVDVDYNTEIKHNVRWPRSTPRLLGHSTALPMLK